MRRKLAKNVVRNGTLTFRINKNQEKYLEEAQDAVEQATGFVVSKAWVVLKLIEHGKDLFEKEYGFQQSRERDPSKKKKAA